MPTRLILLIFGLIFSAICCSILSCGLKKKDRAIIYADKNTKIDINKKLPEPFQKRLIMGFFRFIAYILLPITGMRTELKIIDFDYSYYLGENYKD